MQLDAQWAADADLAQINETSSDILVGNETSVEFTPDFFLQMDFTVSADDNGKPAVGTITMLSSRFFLLDRGSADELFAVSHVHLCVLARELCAEGPDHGGHGSGARPHLSQLRRARGRIGAEVSEKVMGKPQIPT